MNFDKVLKSGNIILITGKTILHKSKNIRAATILSCSDIVSQMRALKFTPVAVLLSQVDDTHRLKTIGAKRPDVIFPTLCE